MDTQSSNERRKEAQRRLSDFGPPHGVAERRVNIERRLFDLSIDCGGGWGNSRNTGGRRDNAATGC